MDFENLYPKWNCPVCGDWFHMPYKFCKCKSPPSVATTTTGNAGDFPMTNRDERQPFDLDVARKLARGWLLAGDDTLAFVEDRKALARHLYGACSEIDALRSDLRELLSRYDQEVKISLAKNAEINALRARNEKLEALLPLVKELGGGFRNMKEPLWPRLTKAIAACEVKDG